MSDDIKKGHAEVEMTKDEYEAESEHAYQLGQSTGLCEAGSILMEQATMAFQRGEDDKAKDYRDLAGILNYKGKDRHPGVPKN